MSKQDDKRFQEWWRSGVQIDFRDYKGTALEFVDHLFYETARAAYAAGAQGRGGDIRELVEAAHMVCMTRNALSAIGPTWATREDLREAIQHLDKALDSIPPPDPA